MNIFLAGHNGPINSAILRKLKTQNYKNIITINKKKLNLLNQSDVFRFIKKKKTKYCYYSDSESWWRLSQQYSWCRFYLRKSTNSEQFN